MADDDWIAGSPSDDWIAGPSEPVHVRSGGERFSANVSDSAARSGFMATLRDAYGNPLKALPASMPEIGKMPAAPSILDAGPLGWGVRAGAALKGVVDRMAGRDDAFLSPTKEKARRADYEEQSAADPWYAGPKSTWTKIGDAASTLAGQVVGAFADPMNVAAPEIGVPGRLAPGVLGRIINSAPGKRILGNAVATGAGDIGTQAADVESGVQSDWIPGQTGAAFALGGALGGGMEAARAAHGVGRQVRDFNQFLKNEPNLFNGGVVQTPAAPAAKFEPVTVDSLWGALTKQEHGLDKDGHSLTSPKGARGPAQLMPDTAEEVATKIGKPELAQMAMGDGPVANLANEVLGKHYLNDQLQAFDGDPALALAAYNAGPGKVREWIKTFGHPDEVGRARWLAMIPYKETRDYVHHILGDTAGTPHTLSPADMAFMRGRMDQFPGEAPTELPPLEPEAAAPVDDFPGDRPAAPAPADDFKASIPWEEDPVSGEKSDTPSPKEIPAGQDLTDQALDQMRSGKKLRMGEGPSLTEALVKAGGLNDADGSLAGIFGAGDNRLQKMLRRVTTGMDMDTAAQWAQERGYIGRPDLNERATPQDLLDAIHREVNGDKVYPSDRINEHARALQEHINDLDELVQHLGLDLEKTSNADVRRAMDEWMNGPDEPGSMGMKDTGEVLGLNPKAAMASGDEAVARVRDAHQRAFLRNEIMASTQAGSLTGSRAPAAIGAPRDAAGAIDVGQIPKVQGIPDIIRGLADALGYPVRQGRISMRNALGTYSRRSGVVRTKGRYDLNVLAHEFGHALEFTDGHRLPNVLKALKTHEIPLKRLDYNQTSLTKAGKPPPGRRSEGFAEWFRWYITNPAYADSMPGAQAFRQDFEAALAVDDPKALAAIQGAQQAYQAFLDAPSLAATREHVVAPEADHPIQKLLQLSDKLGPFGALREMGDEAYRGVFDFLNPWKLAVEKAQEVAKRSLGYAPKLVAAADPYKLLRSMASVAAVGHMDLLHGVHGYHSLEPESPSFVKALALAMGDKFFKWDEATIRDFGTYLVGRRVVDLYDSVGRVTTDAEGRKHGMETPPDGLSRKAWAQTVADLEELHPHWEDAAQMLYEWNGALWKKRRDAGFTSESAYLAGLEDHPNYVPLFRDISDKEFGGDVGGVRGAGTKNAGGVVRLKGSDRAYINPLYSMMNMAYELNTQIARNDALKALDNLGQLLGPDIGQVVERIPAHQLVGTTTSVDEVIANAAKHYGVSGRDAAVITDAVREMFGAADDDAMNTAVYRAKAVGENGEPIVYVWREGERIPLRLPDGQWGKHMVEGLAGMTQPLRSAMLDFAAIPAALLRAGVTAHPAFFLANSFRDQITAFVLTNVGYRPFIDQIRGLGHEAKNHMPGMGSDDLSRIYNVASGEVGGYQSAAAHEAHAAKDLQALRQKGATVRHFATWDGFAHFTETSETGTRLGIFERALKDAKSRGLSDYEAAREASFEARDYMDFDRHGAWTSARVLARVIPFMNAGLQALDKTRRVSGFQKGFGGTMAAVVKPIFGQGAPATPDQYRDFSHAMKLWITAGMLAVGGLAIRTAYRDDPEYQEVADSVRNTHWIVKLPDGNFGAIPKPYEISVFSNLFERAFEAGALKDPTAWARFGQGLEDIFIPAHDPAFLMPIFDIARNRDNLGAPIVPDYLKSKLARDQYTDRTSDIAKWIGAHVNGEEGMSPAQIDFIIKSWGGSNARDALDASHQRAPISDTLADTYVAKRFVKDWTRGSTSTKAFYDLVSGSDGRWGHAVASLSGLVNEGKYPDAIQRLHAMDAPERAYVMTAVFAHGESHVSHGTKPGDFVKQDHPLFRAQAAAGALSGFARDLMDGNVRGPDLQPIEITPDQRRDAVHALREAAVAEQRNGMIMAGVDGWANRPPLPETKYLHDFQKAAPQLVPALVRRFEDDKVQNIDVTERNWASFRHALEAPHPDVVLTQMMQTKRFPEAKSGKPTAAAMGRAMSDVVPAPR